MISKQEIISFATNLRLQPSTVEKDYVLSWVLYGISQNSKLSEWFFKGGTCLKKCYFETYRFSEDLDFTVSDGAIYDETDIRDALSNVADFIYEVAGINLLTREIEIKESINKNGRKTYVAKYTYLGPLNLPSRQQQRIKFDITDDEVVVDHHDMRNVFHLYSDAPESVGKIKCYSVNEILAEKTRAIYERQGRARDIYDIVNISRNFREYVDVKIARKGLQKKFAFKSLPDPSIDLILSRLDFSQLKAGWQDQLGHQLEVLPSVENFYEDLRSALSWLIDENPQEFILDNISNAKGEISLPRAHFPETNKLFGHLDQIRFAARNRLCIEIDYHGFKRLVEPYSIRYRRTGSELLYVYELTKEGLIINQIKAYKLHEIDGVVVRQESFIPKYFVEL